jgi:hypothetical protein
MLCACCVVLCCVMLPLLFSRKGKEVAGSLVCWGWGSKQTLWRQWWKRILGWVVCLTAATPPSVWRVEGTCRVFILLGKSVFLKERKKNVVKGSICSCEKVFMESADTSCKTCCYMCARLMDFSCLQDIALLYTVKNIALVFCNTV